MTISSGKVLCLSFLEGWGRGGDSQQSLSRSEDEEGVPLSPWKETTTGRPQYTPCLILDAPSLLASHTCCLYISNSPPESLLDTAHPRHLSCSPCLILPLPGPALIICPWPFPVTNSSASFPWGVSTLVYTIQLSKIAFLNKLMVTKGERGREIN